ncbi:unannotated protein [freshwater metagenome]|uniref:Unannotated protein n=1 Tax=freshwater metagenome TaxID=449393 RepID=A0A6J6UI93_9ZZZZ
MRFGWLANHQMLWWGLPPLRFRNVIFFAFGEDATRALSEDSNTSFDPEAWERIADADLPPSYLDYLAELDGAK